MELAPQDADGHMQWAIRFALSVLGSAMQETGRAVVVSNVSGPHVPMLVSFRCGSGAAKAPRARRHACIFKIEY